MGQMVDRIRILQNTRCWPRFIAQPTSSRTRILQNTRCGPRFIGYSTASRTRILQRTLISLRFHSVADILADVLFAVNGLPSPVLEESGAPNVLATIHNPKERQRLPARLLKKNMAPRLNLPFRTIEEARAELKRRGLPADRILNALKSSRRS